MTGYLNPSASFWHGKRVLLTGHTGFKGAWLALWLSRLGALVTGISLPPETTPNLFSLAKIQTITETHYCDIRDAALLSDLIEKAEPEIVFHLAAQALVHPSYRDPLTTFSTNVQGTANVLDALRELNTVRVVVAITTDKVYKNLEHPYPYRETDALGGHDPYSASKAAAEIVIASYKDSYLSAKGIGVASARAGNVIGGGDWSADRLIPDAIRAWDANQPLQIRRPQSVRPWQHVLDPLNGYLTIGVNLMEGKKISAAYNFGPGEESKLTVQEMASYACSQWPESLGIEIKVDSTAVPESGLLWLSSDLI